MLLINTTLLMLNISKTQKHLPQYLMTLKIKNRQNISDILTAFASQEKKFFTQFNHKTVKFFKPSGEAFFLSLKELLAFL